nr:hypothetical protein [Tanacetum cinerariifolium]
KGVVTLDWVAGDDRCLSSKSPIIILMEHYFLCLPFGKCRMRLLTLVIKYSSRTDLHHLRMFSDGRKANAPEEDLLDIVLQELPSNQY